jgi:tetratricopeptide (TPR) repeat protein
MNSKLKATTLTLAVLSLGVCFQQFAFAYDPDIFPGKGSKESFNKSFDLCDRAADLQDKGNLKESLALYQQAVANYPYAAVFHYNLGQAYAKVKDYRNAVTSYKTAIKLAPDFQYAYSNISSAHFKLRQLQEAEHTASKATVLDSRDAAAWLNLAQAEIAMNKSKLAKQHVLKAKNLPNAKEYSSDIAELDQKLRLSNSKTAEN